MTDVPDVEELEAVSAEWASAVVADDAARMASFMTDDWVIVSASGISPREELLDAVRSGDLTHSAMDRVGDARVRVYGDTAVVTARVTNTAHHRGRRFDADEWTTDVFVRRNGRWLCALSHITAVEPGPATAAPRSSDTSDEAAHERQSRLDRPVLDANFADPDVLEVGGTYHAYATNSDGRNVQHATSTDLRRWTQQPDALPVLGHWVDTDCAFPPGGATDRCIWAPGVAAVDDGYALYYTARDRASNRQGIGVATSASPDGPFEPRGDGPLVCPAAEGGAIDAGTFVEDGRRYLLWKNDGNSLGLPTYLYLQPMSGDGLTLTGPPVPLVRNDQPWEGLVNEAPTLMEHDGTYVLFYSANDFAGGHYATGYATASTLTGPYTKSTVPLMTTELLSDQVVGPGGQDVVVGPDGRWRIVFHGWDPTNSYRAMYVRGLDWDGDRPVVEGVKVR